MNEKHEKTVKIVSRQNILLRFAAMIVIPYAFLFMMGPLSDSIAIVNHYSSYIFVTFILIALVLLTYLIIGIVQFQKQRKGM